jgi:hypothetical protein
MLAALRKQKLAMAPAVDASAACLCSLPEPVQSACLLVLPRAEHGAEVILGVRNTSAGEKLAKEIM